MEILEDGLEPCGETFEGCMLSLAIPVALLRVYIRTEFVQCEEPWVQLRSQSITNFGNTVRGPYRCKRPDARVNAAIVLEGRDLLLWCDVNRNSQVELSIALEQATIVIDRHVIKRLPRLERTI